jgi:hypothetical protein
MNGHHMALIELLKNHFRGKEIAGIEIGTYKGWLALDILPACLNVKMLYTIDPYRHIEGDMFEAGLSQQALDCNRKIALKNLEKFKDRVTILHLPSDSAFYLFDFTPDNSSLNIMVDFVWIDGSHNPEDIAKDFRFERLIRPGGLIGGHDFGIFQPMTEIIKLKYKDKIYTGEDFIWWVAK